MRAEGTEPAPGRRYHSLMTDVALAGQTIAGAQPGEVRAFVTGAASPEELDDDLVAELGWGISTALGLYAELGQTSCNLAMYGAPVGTAGYPLNLRIVLRSSLAPLYRSDVTWLERLHGETATDLRPEDLAERAGRRFAR